VDRIMKCLESCRSRTAVFLREVTLLIPFALSLSKGCLRTQLSFDKLRMNGKTNWKCIERAARIAFPLIFLFALMPGLYSYAQENGPYMEADAKAGSMERNDQFKLPEGAHLKDYPVWGPEPDENSPRVIQAFPQDGAFFTQDFVITLGWRGLSPDFFNLDRYEILIVSEDGYNQRQNLGPFDPLKPTFILFSPPTSSRYFWQVWAYMTDGAVTSSTGRHFTIEPEMLPE
jgi:hypothetical protein